jgi:hypothetical protein
MKKQLLNTALDAKIVAQRMALIVHEVVVTASSASEF